MAQEKICWRVVATAKVTTVRRAKEFYRTKPIALTEKLKALSSVQYPSILRQRELSLLSLVHTGKLCQTFACKLQLCQSLDKFAVPVYTMKLRPTLQNFCLVKFVKFVLTIWRAKGDCVWLLQQ